MRLLIIPVSGPFHALLATLALVPATLFAATEIRVATSGNDANPGTVAQPVATPQGAQIRVRALIQASLSNAVDVVFAAGTYNMTAPLELRPEDSGTAAFPITWKAASNGTVVLSGGKRITGTWTNGGGGIWFTDLTGVGLGTNQWNFRQLFVNGQRAVRARYPNVTQANPFLYATGGSTNYVIINSNLVKSSWGTASDAQINIVPQSRFFNQWNTVTGVNTNTGRIDIADSERHRLMDSGSWFWIEGVQAELDEPNEWFLNPTTGRLYYMPTNGVDPNSLEIIAPWLNRIVNVKGDVNVGTHVQYVNFDGLGLRYTDFTIGQIEARVATDTAIMLENTSNSSVRNCRFENIGGYALWLHLDSQRNVFDRNTVTYSGAGGVLLTGARFAYMDDSKLYTPGDAAAKVAPILNDITRNTVEHCGKIRYYGGGVHLDSRPFSMTMAPGNYIAHNHFNDLSRNGVFAFRNQGGNVVEYNHIHNCMQTTIDGAAIHFATMNTLNARNFLLNNWLYDIWGWSQKPDGIPTRSLGNGVFLDWDTSNTTVKDNWIYNSVGGAVKVIFAGNQNVVQSGNQYSNTVITPPFVAQVGPDGTASYGIVMANNKLTGSVIHYTDSEHFSSNGTWVVETAIGIVNLFEFKFLTGTAAAPSQAIYTLPITEDGNYQISLLYKPGSDRASNVPVTIKDADGITNITWNMRQGSQYGFAVPIGTCRFVAAQTNTVTLSTTNTNGKVIADSVGFVKIEDNVAPVATNVQVSGSAVIGGTLTGSYTYSDANNDLENVSRFQWYRSADAVFDAGDAAISGATNQSYVVQPADTGYYLFFEITPVALTGITSGTPVLSAASALVTGNVPPTATGVSVSGTPQVGSQLTGAYTYSDAEGDVESGTTFQWYRSDDGTLDAGDTAIAGATNSSYTVQAGDSGRTLFFQVTPKAATGSPTGSAAASGGVPIPAAPPGSSSILIKENFGGTGAALNGTIADTFDAAITAAGGSSTWVAAANFLDNGVVTLATRQAAYLNLGNYMDKAKGTAAGLFNLTMTISPTTGTWISLGFATNNTPNTLKDFTDSGSGTATTAGMATILYRATNATPTANALACFAGPKNALGFGNITGITGNRTLTVILDLTPAAYNGTNNFGKVTWSDSVLGTLTNYTYTSAQNFRSILITESASSSGTISGLTLTQVTTSLKITSISVSDGDLQGSVATVSGYNYVLQTATNLTWSITWQNESTNAGTGGDLILSVPVEPGKPQKFLRFWVY